VQLLPSGRELARPPENITTLEQYVAEVRSQVKQKATLKMFDAIVAKYNATLTLPVEMTREELGEAAKVGYAGGYFDQVISPLSTLGLVERASGKITSTDLMFPRVFVSG
jgi:hypothetical protein